MTKEDKELLLKDLCARLPYGVKCYVPTEGKVMTLTGKRLNYFCFHDEKWDADYSHEYEVVLDPLNDIHNGYIIKPYLRSMSSTTEEEDEEYINIDNRSYSCPKDYAHVPASDRIDWFNAHHFDYRGLIKKGLALEAPKGMYNIKGEITMARWCLRNDYALNDDEKWNSGCTDEWGTHHQCEGCPHNRYMGDGKAISI